MSDAADGTTGPERGGPASLAALARLPYWPRRLSATQAAAYLGVSTVKFLADVDGGKWPKAQRDGTRALWDRRLLDARVDDRSGLSEPAHPNAEYLKRFDDDDRPNQGD